MTLLLPTLAVAFAAFCVWLTVRVVNRKERWAKWTAVGVLFAIPVLYVASFGPVCWSIPPDRGPRCIPRAYLPIGWVARRSSNVRYAVARYADLYNPSGVLVVPDGEDGTWLFNTVSGWGHERHPDD